MRKDRTKLAQLAEHHTNIMEEQFAAQIAESVKNTLTYSGSDAYDLRGYTRHNVSVVEIYGFTTEQAISALDLDGKVAVLNFASYKNPGGGFLNGMTAQEEALCHASNLYNILKNFGSYYNWNRKNLNNGLYFDRALYTPGVQFNCGKVADVITCAAPNLSPIIRYNTLSQESIIKWQIRRVAFMLNVCKIQQVDTLVLGAWGCGVFKNDPYTIAYLFKYFLNKMNGQFKRIIFAIPGEDHSGKLKIFNDVFNRKYVKNDETQALIERALEEYENTLS